MIATLDEAAFATAHERDCARVFGLLADGAARSRGDLGRLLGLRSTTTSHIVGDLIARRLVREVAGGVAGRGRPAGNLLVDPLRVGASVILVASQSLVGSLVDLSGRVVAEQRVAVDGEADNAVLARELAVLAQRLREAAPREMLHAGTAVCLSGLVDLERKRWIMAARWPRMRNLDIEAVLGATGAVSICRSIDAELRARAARAVDGLAGGSLLLHWGWGVGVAFGVDGEPFSPAGGPFGEIGHWRLAALDGRRCRCGGEGCLETGTALWALLPLLQERWPELSEDETRLASQLAGCDLLAIPEIEQAVRLLARSVANAARLLFPRRVIISGPFVANAPLWARLDTLLRADGGMPGLPMPDLINVQAGTTYETEAAAAPLISRALEAALKAP